MILSGNINEDGASAAAELQNFEIIDDFEYNCAVKTSTKRQDVGKDLDNVWNTLNDVYKKQIRREQEYLEDLVKGDEESDSDEDIESESPVKCVRIRKASISKSTRNISWNNGNVSSVARTDPWVYKYDFDEQGFKVYTHVEMNPSLSQTLEGSFTSVSPVDVTEDDFCDEYLTGRPTDVTGFKPYWDFYLPITATGISQEESRVITPPNKSKKHSWRESLSSMFSKPKVLRVN